MRKLIFIVPISFYLGWYSKSFVSKIEVDRAETQYRQYIAEVKTECSDKIAKALNLNK